MGLITIQENYGKKKDLKEKVWIIKKFLILNKHYKKLSKKKCKKLKD